jgi:hypothetical protein
MTSPTIVVNGVVLSGDGGWAARPGFLSIGERLKEDSPHRRQQCET